MQSRRNQASSRETNLVALNFRVPLELRRHLRIVAAQRGITMTSLVLDTLHAVIQAHDSPSRKESLNDTNEFLST
jgi:predicted HicB family RNase H-like nuclease